MITELVNKLETVVAAYSQGSTWIDVGCLGGDMYSLVSNVDVQTPAAKGWVAADVNTTAETITITAHGFITGNIGQVSTAGTLPAPLLAATDYFVIKVDANTIQLATSLVNALAGTPINLSSQGVGASTFTPSAISGASIKLQQSEDASHAVDLGSATNVTVDAVVNFEKDRPTMRYIRAYITLAAGQISAPLQILVKGDRNG